MISRRSVIGIAVLCALVVSAFAAAGASAVENPFRAYTCEPVSTGRQFSDEHCKTEASGAGTGWKHTLITGEKTPIVGTNAATADEGTGHTNAHTVAKLHGVISGVETEIQCTHVTGSGELTNAAGSVTGNGTIIYKETCAVTKPAGRNCVVTGGEVTTKKLTATTVGQEANKVKFTPFEGTQFAVIPISGCLENIPPTGNYPVTGSLVATATGATLTTTGAGVTAQGTLKFGGQVAGLDGALTIRMAPVAGVEQNPITLTK
jgi:type 1 fimbria pilin